MKIVHIITRLILGGAQENTLITCDGLIKKGHDVLLITGPADGPEGELFHKARGIGCEYKTIKQLVRQISPIDDFIAYCKIKSMLKKFSPDVVHTHSAKAGILGRLAANSLKQRPVIVHGIHGHSFGSYQNALLNKFYIGIEKFVAKKTDAFICVADAMKREAIDVGIGNGKIFKTAYSAIEQEQYLREYPSQEISDFRRKYGIGEQATVIAVIARLAHLKGHEYIIESAKKIVSKYPDCIWLIVGDGELAEEVKENVKISSLRYNFIFTGLLDTQQIPLVLHSSDFLVHCSLREGLARVLPQAMLCEKAVVSFDISGAKEVVTPNAGRLIVPGDVDSLTDACLELIANPQLRKTLGQNGRESVIHKFKPETMVDTILNVYSNLLNKSEA